MNIYRIRLQDDTGADWKPVYVVAEDFLSACEKAVRIETKRTLDGWELDEKPPEDFAFHVKDGDFIAHDIIT